jgi:predicted dehydrogenase
MKEIKFGIIGTSRMAATMMSAFGQLPDVKVVAVASESKGRADIFAHQFNIAKRYGSTDDLLADSQVEAVYIANATENHAKSALAALKACKAVLCEKPIGISLAEAEEISAEAKRAGKLCLEAMWTLFLPAYQRLFDLAGAHLLGAPQHLYADFGYPTTEDVFPRLFTPSPGSGVLLDRGVYLVALALKLLGPVGKVSGQIKCTESGVDTLASLQLCHDNGCLTQLAVSATGLMQNRAVLSLTQGTIALEPPVIGAETLRICRAHVDTNPAPADISALKRNLKRRLQQSSSLRRINSWRKSGHCEYRPYGANQYLPILKHFCELYRDGLLESNIFPLNLSAEVLGIIDEAKML